MIECCTFWKLMEIHSNPPYSQLALKPMYSFGKSWNEQFLSWVLFIELHEFYTPLNICLDCLKIYVPGKRTRSSEDPLKLTYPTKRKEAGDRTFTVASSIEWNKLPLTLRQSPSIETFKKSLKTHLFLGNCLIFLFVCVYCYVILCV